MRPVRNLQSLAKSTTYRLNALRVGFDYCIGGALSNRATKGLITSIAIDALNTWANFSRSYYLSCRVGAYLENHGSVSCVTPFTSFNDCIGDAVTLYRPSARPNARGEWHRRDEPTWHDTSVLLNCCTAVAMSNSTIVAAALSIGTRVFIDLPVLRNYCAHKNWKTADAARAVAPIYGISGTLEPVLILQKVPLNSYDPLLKLWLYEIEVVVNLLCS